MSWGRLDDGFHDHPKVEDLSLAAIGLWTRCLSRALRHRKTAPIPGFVSEVQVRKLAGSQTKKLVAELATPIPGKESGLWEPAEGGWIIHDFADYLPRERDPEEAAESGRKGAQAKWAKQGKQLADSHSSSQTASQEASSELANSLATDMANDGPRASRSAFPSRPVPSRTTKDQDLGGERQETFKPPNATQHPPDEDPHTAPSEARCPAHRGITEPPPCAGCRNARERAERRADAAADQERRATEDAIRDCPDCGGTGWLEQPDTGKPAGKCTHSKARRTA